jgi:hypothetical protein
VSDNTSDDLLRDLEKVAAGKLKCPCGNEDWRHFLFVTADPDYTACCKACGSVFQLSPVDGWCRTRGPATRGPAPTLKPRRRY